MENMLFMNSNQLAEYNCKYTRPLQKPYASGKGNMIFSKNINLSTDCSQSKVNLNSLIIGGIGVEKTNCFIAPNIMQCNSSMVIVDPSCGLYKQYQSFLREVGFQVKCLNLSHIAESHHYNPFCYITDESDIECLADYLIANTDSHKALQEDDFWTKCEKALLSAVLFYLYYHRPKEEQNLYHVIHTLQNDIETLDSIFDALRETNPDCKACVHYDTFRVGAGKTYKSIIIGCCLRLHIFDSEEVRYLTATDDMNLHHLAKQKMAIFINLSSSSNTLSFCAGMLCMQALQLLKRQQDSHDSAPLHVHFFLEQFLKIGRIPHFIDNAPLYKILSFTIFVPSIPSLKQQFSYVWDIIPAICDTIVYLGHDDYGNDFETIRWVAQLLNNRANLYTKCENEQLVQDEMFLQRYKLPSIYELCMLQRQECIVIPRFSKGYKDEMYQPDNHPAWKLYKKKKLKK